MVVIFSQVMISTSSGVAWDGAAFTALFVYAMITLICATPYLIAGCVLIAAFGQSIARRPIAWSLGFTTACLAFMAWTLHGPEFQSLAIPTVGVLVAGSGMGFWLRVRPIGL